MYDALLKFANESEAKQMLPAYTTNGTSWDQANVIPNVQVWRDSQQGLLGGLLGAVTSLVFLSGYFCWVSLDSVPKQPNSMLQLQLCYDRDALNARQPKSIYNTNLTFVLLNDIRASPVYHGADIPWGQLGNFM